MDALMEDMQVVGVETNNFLASDRSLLCPD